MQNNRGGSGRGYAPSRKQNEIEKHFEIEGDLKDILDVIDDRSIRTRFAQTSDPIHLAFQHIDSKPLKSIAKEFAQDTINDFMSFISKVIG